MQAFQLLIERRSIFQSLFMHFVHPFPEVLYSFAQRCKQLVQALLVALNELLASCAVRSFSSASSVNLGPVGSLSDCITQAATKPSNKAMTQLNSPIASTTDFDLYFSGRRKSHAAMPTIYELDR